MTSVMITIATTRKTKTKRQTIKTTQCSEFSNEQDAFLFAFELKKNIVIVLEVVLVVLLVRIFQIPMGKRLLFMDKFSCRNLPALLSSSL